MPIIKERKFRISSVIENLTPEGLVDGDAERTVSEPEGFFKISDNAFLLTYMEEAEGVKTFSDIEITCKKIYVKRRGGISSDMEFSEGKIHESVYGVAPYSFDVKIYTKKIRNNLTRDGGRVDIFYTMNIGGTDKSVKMKIEVL